MTIPSELSGLDQSSAEDADNKDVSLNRSCQSALSWSDLKTIIGASDLVKLARSEEQKVVYRKGRDAIHNQWDSIYDYLLCTKFGFMKTTNQLTGKQRSEPTFEELRAQRGNSLKTEYRMQLCLNDYPYYLKSGIEHWILWKLDQNIEDEDIEKAKSKILLHCVGLDCDDDRIDMHVGSLVSTITSSKEVHDLTAMINDESIFLHWINPPHLKRLVPHWQCTIIIMYITPTSSML